ncbi:MAG: Na+/H+ antiporter NhaC family protein [Selenomonadaceae bacterium]|nr:Na+/H+ antiporter NhaC family protein [Selenomonadaceae bacterium]
MFYATPWALLPPIFAIALALFTKEVYSSLFAGILLGALLATDFNVLASLNMVAVDGFSASVARLSGNLCFLVLLGMIAALITKSGGSAAFGRWAQKNIKSRVGAQLATFFLGILIFIDDYFNCLTVGTVMRPVTDSQKISRAKLAYLIDSTAAPICIIAPISTWSAAVSGIAAELNTGVTGIQLFIQTIPYNFYSLLTIAFVFTIVCMNLDYGKMLTVETNARLCEEQKDTTNIQNNNILEEIPDKPNAILSDLTFPIITLIASCVFFMLYAGGYFGANLWIGAENMGNISAAFGATKTGIALPCGAVVTILITFLYYSLRHAIGFKEMTECLPLGYKAMMPGILLLIFAVSLKTITNHLGTAEYVHNVMMGVSSEVYSLLPAIIFLVSIFLAFSTGTSYGTFGVMLPIVIAVFSADSPLMIVGMAACLSGAVCGDHCSPISDTTIMSSAGAQANHIEHVYTQLPYALSVAAISFVSYIVAGFYHNPLICLGVGLLLMGAFCIFMKKRIRFV